MKRIASLTPYQFELLRVVGEGTPEEPVDFDQLLERLSWAPKKESAQFVIRAVIEKGLMAKTDLKLRRGRRRVCYILTTQGRLVLDPRGASAAPAESAGAEKGVEEKALKATPGALEDLAPGLPDEPVGGFDLEEFLV